MTWIVKFLENPTLLLPSVVLGYKYHHQLFCFFIRFATNQNYSNQWREMFKPSACLLFQNHMSLCQLLTVTRSSMEWAVLYSWTDLENNCQLQNFNFIKAGYCSCYSNQTMQLNTTHSNQINATLLKREFFQWFTKPPIWSAGKSSGLVENTWQNWMTTRQWPAC